MTALAGALSIAAALSPAADPPRAECLPYEPQVVTLVGTLRRRTFPGPPNYESVAKGDDAETGLPPTITRRFS